MDVQRLLDEVRTQFDVRMYDHTTAGIHSLDNDTDASKWSERFHHHYVAGHSEGRDDLLFYVKCKNKKSEDGGETVDVLRKNSRNLSSPSDRTLVVWDKTFYLNLILHEFEYQVTCSILTLKPENGRIDEVTVKVTQQVYPSPSKRSMGMKSDCHLTYPNIMFCVDNFEEVFSSLHVTAPGQKVGIQLLAINKGCSIVKVVFLGAVDYCKLLEACEKKDNVNSHFSSKLKSLSFLSKVSKHSYRTDNRYHFLQMRGPLQKGYAELAINKSSADSQISPAASVAMETEGRAALTMPTSGGVNTQQKHQYSPKLRHLLRLDSPCEDGGASAIVDIDDESPFCPDPRDEGGCRGGVAYGDSDAESAVLQPGIMQKAFKSKISPMTKKDCRKPSPSSSLPPPLLNTYLTYVQLPWYSLVEDVLNTTKEPAF